MARRHLSQGPRRRPHRLVAAIIAVAVTTEGRREIIGLGIGPSEAEPFWSSFLKGLVKRGLKGVKLVISDAHDGLRLAITRVLGATWQRCRVHWMRNALAHVPKGQHAMVAAAIRQAFLQTEAAAAHQTWRHVADQLRARWPKLGTLMDDSEHDVLAYITFPAQHRTKLHSTDEIDKPFRRELLFSRGTGDCVAKSRARGCKPGHAAFSVVPHLRHPCAACHCRAAAIG